MRLVEASLLAGILASACLASPPAGPGVTALALLDVARQQGLEPRVVDVRWDPDQEKLHCLVAADDFPLDKATAFLMMAEGRSTISREEVGRRIEFPVAAEGFRPVPGPGALAALEKSMGELAGGIPGGIGRGPEGRGVELAVEVPGDKAEEVFLRASQVEGRAAWTRARLEPRGARVHVELGGVSEVPEGWVTAR